MGIMATGVHNGDFLAKIVTAILGGERNIYSFKHWQPVHIGAARLPVGFATL